MINRMIKAYSFVRVIVLILIIGQTMALYGQDYEMDTGDFLNSFFKEAATEYKYIFSLVSPAVSKTLTFSDATIEITFEPMDEKQLEGPYNLAFWFTNKTTKPIEINWEACTVTSLAGKPQKVFHGDMTYVSFTDPQDNSFVGPGDKIGEAVVPQDSVTTIHHRGEYDDYGEWIEPWDEIGDYTLLVGLQGEGYDKIKAYAVGKKITFVLSLIVDKKPKKYEFTLKIDDITKVENKQEIEF